MQPKILCLVFALLPFFVQGQEMYMTISGAIQGNISTGAGNSNSIGVLWDEDHEDEIFVLAMEQDICVPTDTDTGVPTGPAQLGTLKIKKYTDKASPLLAQATATGELLNLEIKIWRTGTTGMQEQYFTIVSDNATIVNHRFLTADLTDSDASNDYNAEEVTFRITNIEYSHEISGTSAFLSN